MAVNALGFLNSICITVFMSPCILLEYLTGQDHDSLSTQRFFQGKQLSRDPRSGSCDRSDPDVAIKAYRAYLQPTSVCLTANLVLQKRLMRFLHRDFSS